MRENDFQSKVIEQLESQAAWVFNIWGNRMQKSGIPDLFVAHPRWSGFLELKCQERKPSDIQISTGIAINLRKFPAYVLRCKDNNITIENFHGAIVARPDNLKQLLDALQDLREQTIYPYTFYHDAKMARSGDSISLGDGREFVCFEMNEWR